jgi:hypothetical protein
MPNKNLQDFAEEMVKSITLYEEELSRLREAVAKLGFEHLVSETKKVSPHVPKETQTLPSVSKPTTILRPAAKRRKGIKKEVENITHSLIALNNRPVTAHEISEAFYRKHKDILKIKAVSAKLSEGTDYCSFQLQGQSKEYKWWWCPKGWFVEGGDTKIKPEHETRLIEYINSQIKLNTTK